ncbi:MAG TPA: FtsQ-type POTRA domain-containing protein [Gemmatimonadales bacterium]|nr:FtsQ-type POTRA domain-containing protein [Gemmatimonadales bacterium]
MARFLKPGWLVLYGACAALAVWFGGPRLFRRMDFFRVRRVEVVGLHSLAATDVLRALAIPTRENVFDDLRPIAARAAAIAGVAHAEVTRRIPGTIRVTLQEVVPVALVPGHGALLPMDAKGRVLPFDPTVAAPDLPVTPRADSLVGELLGRVREADPGLFEQVVTTERDGRDVALDLGQHRYWFRPDATVETIRAVTAVAQDLARRGRAFRELDGRYAGQVVVRWGTA